MLFQDNCLNKNDAHTMSLYCLTAVCNTTSLATAVTAGNVRHIGVNNETAWGLANFCHLGIHFVSAHEFVCAQDMLQKGFVKECPSIDTIPYMSRLRPENYCSIAVCECNGRRQYN